jgi:hypothetical protein
MKLTYRPKIGNFRSNKKNISDVGLSYDNLIKKYGFNSKKNLKKINSLKANKKYKILKKYLGGATLEIGPGSGRFFEIYKKRNFSYTGIEASNLFYLYLNKKFKNKYTNFLNSTYPSKIINSKKYDLAFSLSSIQEKSNYKINSNFFIRKIINQTYKILNVNGLFIFDFFNYENVDFKEKHLVYLKEKDILFYSKKFKSCKIVYPFKKDYEGIVILKK